MGALKDYNWTEDWVPHVSRRKAMLAKYGPQIKALYGPDRWTAVQVISVVCGQTAFAWVVRSQPIWTILLTAYFVGTFANHNLFLAVHEISHNLAFYSPFNNKLLGVFANLPICVPFTTKFNKYHKDHHAGQGVEGIDVDIPSRLEAELVKNKTWRKLVWISLQVLLYALRPVFVNPLPMDAWDLFNAVACIVYDLAILHFMGWRSMVYLLASNFVGGGIHPMAGHFISEHYNFDAKQETYSYYGPLNYLTYRVGYHNEHHDFPTINCWKLHKLHEIAPEYYKDLHYHTSWSKVIYEYLTSPKMGPYSRTMRLKTAQYAISKADNKDE